MNATVVTALHLIAFLGIGLLISTLLAKKKIIQSQFALIATYAIGCIIGYLLFYVYAYNPRYGTVSTGIFYLLGLISFCSFLYLVGRDPALRRIVKRDILPPLALILVVCTFYSATSLSCTSKNTPPREAYNVYQSCMLSGAAGDNILAEFFGDNLILNQDGILAADWHLADRPPLQIGSVISLLDTIPDNVTKLASYQIFSTFLQLGWLAGLWALLRSMKVKKASQNLVLFLSVFTGFYYVNSVYVWPKLLAAGFATSAIALLIYSEPLKHKNILFDYYKWTLAILLLTLAMLAHGSVLFTILPLTIYILIKRRLPALRVLLVALTVSFVIYAPWMLYQAHTTSSDRLIKWHLAGVIKIDDRSTIATIKDSYSKLSASEWLTGRAKNVRSIFVEDSKSSQNYMTVFVDKNDRQDNTIEKVRSQEYFSAIWAFSILNVGWFAAVFVRKKDKELYSKIKPLALLGLASLGVWCLVMFIPGSTVNHQGSYATLMLLFTFLILAISGLNKYARILIASMQITLFLMIWVLQALYENQQSRGFALCLNLIGVATVALAVYYAEIGEWIRDHITN